MKLTLNEALKQMAVGTEKAVADIIYNKDTNQATFILVDKGSSRIRPLKRTITFTFDLDTEVDYQCN